MSGRARSRLQRNPDCRPSPGWSGRFWSVWVRLGNVRTRSIPTHAGADYNSGTTRFCSGCQSNGGHVFVRSGPETTRHEHGPLERIAEVTRQWPCAGSVRKPLGNNAVFFMSGNVYAETGSEKPPVLAFKKCQQNVIIQYDVYECLHFPSAIPNGKRVS